MRIARNPSVACDGPGMVPEYAISTGSNAIDRVVFWFVQDYEEYEFEGIFLIRYDYDRYMIDYWGADN